MNSNQQEISQKEPSMIKKFLENTKKLNLYQNISQIVRLTFEYKGNIQEQAITNDFKILIHVKNLNGYLPTRMAPKCENILQNRVFVCYDCQVNAEAFICQECFYSAGHDIKCHYQIKEIPEFMHGYYICCCGNYQKMSYKGTCCKHHQRELIEKQSKQTQEKAVLDFISYYTDCWKLFICLSTTFLQMKDQMNNDQIQKMREAIFSNYGRQLFNNFSSSIFYSNKCIQKISSGCLLSKTNVDDIRKTKQLAHLNKDTSILEILLQILPCSLEEELICLIQKLLISKSESLVRQFVSSIFNCPMTNGKMNKLGWITKLNKKLKLEPSFYCKVMCDLASDGKFAYEEGQQVDAIKFYAISSCPNLFLKQNDKRVCSLVECWKGLFSRGILTPQNIIKTPGFTLTQILMFTIYDEQLFHQIIISLIKFIKSEQSEVKLKLKLGMIKKIEFNGLCDGLVELLNNYFEGQIGTIAKYLKNITLDSELVVIAYSYFNRCIKQPAKMNGQTLAIFGAYLQTLRVQQPIKYLQYERLVRKRTIQKRKLTQFIGKSLKYLISEQLFILSKKNKYLHKRSLDLEKNLEKKFKQFLCMRKKVPRKQIHKMLKQKILNFVGATQIIRNYTTYDLNSDSFIFTSEEQEYFNYDGILNSILSQKQEVSILFTPEVSDYMFTTDNRRNIITGIFTPFLKEKEMKIYKNQEKIQYIPSVCLIIIDKIINGEIAQLRKYLIEVKQTLSKQNQENLKNSEQKRLSKLFGISEINKKTCNENQNLMNFDEKLLESAQQTLINEVSNSFVKAEQKQQSTYQKSEKIKTSKHLKLAQKFKLKQQKILKKNNICTNIEPEKNNNTYKQICMICKQQGNLNNALFYLGILNKQNNTNQIFQSAHRKQYTIDLCMHVIHEKCYLSLCKGSVFQCPLCKIFSNIVFPYQNQIMDGRAREFMQNRLTYTFIQSYNEYHYENTFNFILKTLIAEVLSNSIFNVIMRSSLPAKLSIQKNLQQKKINYYFGFLKQWWDSLEQYEKTYFMLKVEKCMSVNQQAYSINFQKQRNPKQILDTVLCFIIWGCICQKNFTSIIERQISLLEQLIDQSEFNSLMAYLQKQFSVNNQLCKGKLLLKKQHKRMNFINHFFKPPQTLSQLQFVSKSCKNCKKASKGWYCLQCNESFCNMCGHEKFHGNILAKLNSINGKIEYQDKNGILHAQKLYANSFMQTWSSAEQNHDDYFDYRICNDLFRRILSK